MAELIYLASPYSDPSPDVRCERFEAVCRIAARLMAEGSVVYSPIAHNHQIAVTVGLPFGWEWWEKFDRRMLMACDVLVVAKIDGWDKSTGVAAELKIAEEFGLPVRYVDA